MFGTWMRYAELSEEANATSVVELHYAARLHIHQVEYG
ncbi:hypothetical protein EDO6_03239 [Paenibacillus xylanexedens]|nr:hypothetical protein EDO6_03239 [Paenibacillus xylanexedens]